VDSFPILFPFFFVVMWVFINIVLAKLSGWMELAKNYRSTKEFEGERWNMRWAKINFVDYKGCINFGSNRNGLYMSVIFPFNFGSKPLLIPWIDILTIEKKGWFFDYVVLNFKKNPNVDIKISKRFWNKILNSIYIPKDFKGEICDK